MASKNRRSVTLERSVEAGEPTEDDITDSYVHVQVGGGRREPSPAVVTPTRLRSKITATGRDIGLIRDASFCRSQMLPPVTPPQLTTEMDIDNPFLSEPLVHSLNVPFNSVAQESTTVGPPSRSTHKNICDQVSENTTTDRPFDLPHQIEGDIPHTSLPVEDRNADGPIRGGTPSVDNEAHQEAGDITPRQKPVNVNTSRTSMEDPLVEPRSSLSRESSTQASLPPSRQATTPGLAPSTTLDKMGFEPALQVEPLNSLSRESRMQASHRVTKHGIAPPAALDDLGFEPVQMLPASKSKFTRTESTTPVPHSRPHSPSAGTTQAAPSDIFSIPDSTNGAALYDKGKQGFVVGRVSDSVLTMLNKGFDEINEMFSKLAARVRMPFHQVSDRYIRQHSHSHGGNIWNLYSKYFTENTEQELARLPKGEHVMGTPTTDIRKRCYALFKEEYKDTYTTILETWKEAKELENMGGTIAQRQQLFDKSTKNLNHTFNALSKAHGFEGAYLLAGRVINQDAGLGHVFATPSAEKFFAERCCAGDNEIIGHFKAHIYNQVSKLAVDEAFDITEFTTKDEVEEINDLRVKSNRDCSEDREDHDQVKHRLRGLFEEHGQKWGSGKLFPWKQMLPRLASSGLILLNWPDGVMFPSEERHSRTMPKGISDLTLAECSKLLAAMNDTGESQLHLRSVPHLKAALVSSEEPVIIGAAPPYDSKKSHAKRMFCNMTSDWGGPKRVPNKAATRVKKTVVMASISDQIVIEDSDDMGLSEGLKEESCQKKTHASNPPKRNIARVVIPSDLKKKQPSVIELSSDSTSSTTSDHKLTDKTETERHDKEDEDLHASSVDYEDEQALISRKRKPKAMFSSRKAKRLAADESGKEWPPMKSSKGKQPAAQVAGMKRRTRRIPSSPLELYSSSDEGSTARQAPEHKPSTVQHKEPSVDRHAQPSTTETGIALTADHSRPSVEACVHPSVGNSHVYADSHSVPIKANDRSQPSAEARVDPSAEILLASATDMRSVSSMNAVTKGSQLSATESGKPSCADRVQPPADAQTHPSSMENPPVYSTGLHHVPSMINSALGCTRPSGMVMDGPSVADHTQLPVDTRTRPPSVENASFYPTDSRAAPSMTSAPVKQVEKEAVSSHSSDTQPYPTTRAEHCNQDSVPSMDVEMVAAPGLEQTAADAAVDHPTDIQLPPHARSPVDGHSNNAGSQKQRPKPRLVHNPSTRVSQTNPEDAFSLRSRIYPAVPSMVEQTTTMTSASARLVAAEEGLVSKGQEGQLASNALHEDPEHQATHSPIPAALSYDGANPFAPRPPPLPEQRLEHPPGPGMRPLFPQYPDVGPGDNCMQYNNPGWYPSQHGPYGPMPYMPQHYHPAYPPPNPRGAAILQSEHPDRNAPTRFHDGYYNGTIGGNHDGYSSYLPPNLYRFYPPHHPLPVARAGPVPHADGNENPSPGTRHPPNNSGGDKEVHRMDGNSNA